MECAEIWTLYRNLIREPNAWLGRGKSRYFAHQNHTDGGNSWTVTQDHDPSGYGAMVWFVSETLGWYFDNQYSGSFYITRDGGASWTSDGETYDRDINAASACVPQFTCGFINAASFVRDSREDYGWAVGNSGTILKHQMTPTHAPTRAPTNVPTPAPTVIISQVITCSLFGGASGYTGDVKTALEAGYFTAIGTMHSSDYTFKLGCSGTSSATDTIRRSSVDITFESSVADTIMVAVSKEATSLNSHQLEQAIRTAGATLGLNLDTPSITAISTVTGITSTSAIASSGSSDNSGVIRWWHRRLC